MITYDAVESVAATFARQPGISISTFGAGPVKLPPVASAYPRRARALVKQVPAAFLPVFEQLNSLAVNWHYTDPTGRTLPVAGVSSIHGLLNLFDTQAYYIEAQGISAQPIWDAEMAPDIAEAYHVFDSHYYSLKAFVVWRTVADQVELALYLGGARLHPLPFSPVEYLETGLAFHFIELWQLLFIPEEQQADYAEAIGTVAEQVRRLFPEAAHLLPAHVAARFPAPAPLARPDYRQLLAATVARLHNVPGLTLLAADPPGPGATLGAFERVRRETGWSVPAELRAFYGQLNGCRLRWEWDAQDPEEDPRGGSLEFWPLARVFGGREARSQRYWTDTLNDGLLWAEGHAARVPGLAQLRPFEYLNAEMYPCVQLPTASSDPADLFWLSGDLNKINPLRLGFAEYLARAFACAGVYKWQFFYRTDELQGEDPDFARKIEEDLHRLGLDPDQVLPDRQA